MGEFRLIIPMISSPIVDIGLHAVAVLVAVKVGKALIGSLLSWIPFI